MDAVFLTINGERYELWRAVDQEGNIRDMLGQRRRDTHAAKTFFRKLLKACRHVPRVIITDQLKTYGAATREMLPGVARRQHRYLHNRAAKSHQPARQRERRLQGVTSPGHAQRFLSAYGPIAPYFRPRRHLLSAQASREERSQRFQNWHEVTGLAADLSQFFRRHEGGPALMGMMPPGRRTVQRLSGVGRPHLPTGPAAPWA